MAAHAFESPSHAYTWMECAGALVLSLGLPNPSSKYAEEGTLAHACAESWLTNKGILKDLPEGMVEHLSVYVDCINELATWPGALRHIEVKVKVTEDCWGTADAIVWNPATKTLYVRDLKYGAGVGVEVRNNLQLKLYALGALLTMGYPARIVNVGIVQPRFNHVDGPCRSVDFDALDLLDFHADVLDAEARIKRAVADHASDQKVYGYLTKDWIDRHLKTSEKGCRWCLAAPNCPKLCAEVKTIAKDVFAPELPYSPAHLAKALDFLPILEGWVKNVRQFAYDEAEAGRVPPGYKLVPKRATRKWKEDLSPMALASFLKVNLDEVIKPRELRGVAEVEKLCHGANATARAAVLEPYVTKESTGHTLVHESDTREAIRVDASAAFGALS